MRVSLVSLENKRPSCEKIFSTPTQEKIYTVGGPFSQKIPAYPQNTNNW